MVSPSSIFETTLIWIGRVSLGLFGLVLIGGGLLYMKQENLLYLPEAPGVPRHNRDNPRGFRNPKDRGFDYWFDVRLPSYEEGKSPVQIHAWLLIHPSAVDERSNQKLPTLIFFHGNAGNIGIRLPNAAIMMNHLRCHLVLVDYRGYGDSDDVSTITEAGIQADAQAVYHWVRSELTAASLQASTPKLEEVQRYVDPSQIFIYGQSLGGAVAFALAEYATQKQLPLAGIIVENTFLSISDMVDKLFPILTRIKPWVLRLKWNSLQVVKGLRHLPILYLAGAKDELVPHAHMKLLHQASLHEALNKNVDWHVVTNGTHNETWFQGGEQYWKAFRLFLAKYASNSATGTCDTSSKQNVVDKKKL